MTPKLWVFAGNYQQATYFAHEKKLGREGQDWAYASSRDKLQGVNGGQLVIVGTFWDRKDKWELIETAKIVGLTELTGDP